jgi:histidine triad (HIT) family protein
MRDQHDIDNMKDCIFCQIVAGNIPSYKIYEDNNFLAFLDIFPITKGHTLVIPKKHYRWVWDVEDIGSYMQVCQKIAKHYQRVTHKELVMSQIIGNEVPHPHIHLYPDLESSDTNAILSSFAEHKKPQLKKEEAQQLLQKLKLK